MQQEFCWTGQALKESGKELAAKAHAYELSLAREIAERLGRERVSVTIDDVQAALPFGMELGNAAGSVFSGDSWVCVGFVPTKRPKGHGRMVREWRLRG